MQLLQAALNGDREHPAAPRTPEELAAEGSAAVEAGARVLHLHPYDGDGRQTFEAEACAAAIRAVRAACPGIPISLSTSAEIEPDPERRRALVAAWTELPELVTANQGEEGIAELCELLIGRGVGIEAGLLSLADAHAFIASGLAPRCVRAMVEPLGEDPDAAVVEAAAIEDALTAAGITLEQVHHGDGVASWAVNRRAAARGHGIRTGLEDTPSSRRAEPSDSRQPLQREGRPRQRLDSEAHEHQGVVVARNAIQVHGRACGAAMYQRPLAIVAHGDADRLHRAGAVGPPVAGHVVEVPAPQAIRAVVSVHGPRGRHRDVEMAMAAAEAIRAAAPVMGAAMSWRALVARHARYLR